MEHLATVEEVIRIGRPIGGKTDHARIQAYINEAEQLNIKPVLGDRLFLDILSRGEEDERYKLLLSGGTYTDGKGHPHQFAGLKCALAYFVFAKNVMVGDYQTTRYGVVLKESDYSTHLSSKERADCYNDTLEVAAGYLRDCLLYCRHASLPTASGLGGQRASGGITIRKIG